MQQTVNQKPHQGLGEQEVIASREAHGDNRLIPRKRQTFFQKLIENFKDPIIRVLLIAVTVNIVVLFRDINWLEIAGIVVAVLVSTFVSTLSEWGSEKTFEKLSAATGGHPQTVIRGGEAVQIPPEELVVGDIVLLQGGVTVEADGELIEGEVEVDLSPLNGESAEVTKRPDRPKSTWDLSHINQVFRGSLVTEGTGKMRVGRVGKHTMYGEMAHTLGEETRESPLKIRLAYLAGQISRLGYVMAALVAIAYLFSAFVIEGGYAWGGIHSLLGDKGYLFRTLTHTLTLVITVVVVAVPEGLPMMITVVLSSNMRRMQRDHVLVKKMVGIETAGSMNILFTDKTGTLTTGDMHLFGILAPGGALYKSPAALKVAPKTFSLMQISALLNTDSIWGEGKPILGNATDRAILRGFYEKRANLPAVNEKKPFHSRHKYSAVRAGGITYVKGAFEVLLPHIQTYLAPDGTTHPWNHSVYGETEKALRKLAKSGRRFLAVAVGDVPVANDLTDLTLVGFLILSDRIRKEAPEAVSTLHRAGIQVVMVTGDGADTALSIATECGILEGNTPLTSLSGMDMDSLTDEELRDRLPTLRVVYRARPGDKTRLVKAAQSLGLVAGMTGDGINDAPSLKIADVGFGMGSGTDIAKEAGDIVLLDDNIRSVTKTVLYGRTIFSSIRKFITFQLTMNLCAVGVSLLGQFIGIESPITILQMLWVNLIMDTLGGLAFAGEPPIAGYMKEPPKKREERLLSHEMIHQILLTGTYTLALAIWFLVSPSNRFRYGGGEVNATFLTAFFALFIFAGLANCFVARTTRLSPFSNLGGNKPFTVILTCITVMQIWMIYHGGSVFRTVPLSREILGEVVLLSLTVIPFDFLRRVAYRLTKHTPKKGA